MIQRSTILSWQPCYEREHSGWMAAHAAGRTEFTLAEVLAACPRDEDRVWVLTRPGVMTGPQLLEWLARMVERALGRVGEPDPRSIAVVAALRTVGVTREVVEGARAAYAARTVYAARAVTGAVAAYAERAAQVKDAVEIVG